MNVTKSDITKLYIKDIGNLDPISVYLEESKGNKDSKIGKITIECFGKAWSYTFGNIGQSSINNFILDCDNHYLARKLDPDTPSTITDEDQLVDAAKKHIIIKRKNDEITKEHARTLYDNTYVFSYGIDEVAKEHGDILYEIYGDEWWDCLPKKQSPSYNYLYKILDCVKKAIKLYFGT